MAANMYRVGDHVYFESSSSQPYQIRRIEELNKNQHGNVEAKVMCYFRRRDLPGSLMQLADKHQMSIEEDQQEQGFMFDDLTEEERHLQKHRELFLSRQVETVPATHIRGKCSVTLLNETENPRSYLEREDSFYYSLVYDPQQKTLLADKGEIRVGSGYQIAPIPLLKQGDPDNRQCADLEELVYNPVSDLTDRQVDQYLILARSVGTFGRALDCTSTVRQPSLHMSAAAASRDITLLHAMDMLHENGYDMSKAMCSLVATGGPVICRDAMEEWSASEANLFEEALEKYGKDFGDIRNDFLPWKTLKSVIEYYYMWKTTDRYVQQKRVKAAENESKLRIVYIPAYNKPNPNLLSGKLTDSQMGGRPCEGCCLEQCDSWYNWGSLQMQSRLCDKCWVYWKTFGGLRNTDAKTDNERPPPSQRLERVAQYKQLVSDPAAVPCRCTVSGCNKEFRHKYTRDKHLAIAHGLTVRPTSPKPIMKTRAAFCLVTTPLTRLSRVLCKDLLKPRHAARNPIQPINATLIKQECHQRVSRIVKGELKVGKKMEEKVLRLSTAAERPSDRHSDVMSVASPASSLGRKRGFEDSDIPDDALSNDGVEAKRVTPTSGVIRYGNDMEPMRKPEAPLPMDTV